MGYITGILPVLLFGRGSPGSRLSSYYKDEDYPIGGTGTLATVSVD